MAEPEGGKRRKLRKWLAGGSAALFGIGGFGVAEVVKSEPVAQTPQARVSSVQQVSHAHYDKVLASIFHVASMVSGALAMRLLNVGVDEAIKEVVTKLIERLKREFFDDEDNPKTDNESLNKLLKADGVFADVPARKELEKLRADIRDVVFEQARRHREFEADLRMLLGELVAAEKQRVRQTNTGETLVSGQAPSASPFDRSEFSEELLAFPDGEPRVMLVRAGGRDFFITVPRPRRQGVWGPYQDETKEDR